MVHKLYENYLDTPDGYRACEQYWDKLINKITDSLGQRGQWVRWIPRHGPNGSPLELEGLPIFDGRNDLLSRAYRIFQGVSSDDKLSIAAWTKSYEEEYEDLPRHELVISLTLSEESAQKAEALLREWMRPEASPEEMEQFIAEHIDPGNGHDGPT